VVRQNSWQIQFTVGKNGGTLRPLVLLGPILARTIAGWGWSKQDLQRYFFERARMPAHAIERILRDWTQKPTWNIAQEVAAGRLPAVFCESSDPDRLVPLVWKPEDYMIVVTGDPARNSAYVFAHNGVLAYPATKKIA
jgi:hypothetical protein